MFAELETIFRRIRRRFDRSEWAIRHMGLPSQEGCEEEPGLLLIQIDGLSRQELERAVASGRMPFLKELHEKSGYPLRTFYSGVPSTTPAVQGELYYGVKCAVPAFSFREKATGEVGSMFNPQRAMRYEEKLSAQGEGLLKGGASWSNIYSGGAESEECHFCMSHFGLGNIVRRGHWIARFFFLLMQLPAVIRVLGLVILELGIGIYDAILGFFRGREIKLELGMILSRMCVGIGIREWLRVGGKIDVARGLPVVHVNFLGYDEMSHCRGPDSRFARWSLAGIDWSIRDLYRSALRSRRRDYQVWIFSDHGQERTRSFAYEVSGGVEGIIRKALADEGSEAEVAAMGPVGHVYLAVPLDEDARLRVAGRLVQEGVPAVLFRNTHDETVWIDKQGIVQGREILSRLNAYPERLRGDLLAGINRLTSHEDAGDLVILGHAGEGDLWTFAPEVGAHAGIGPRELQGFLLTPPGTWLHGLDDEFVRPGQLRQAALHLLGRERMEPLSAAVPAEARLRIMTYNVHGCCGTEGRISPRRIARIIQQQDPDVVALQEVDHGRMRSRQEDQASVIAEALGYHVVFCPTVISGEERYGHAVLSRWPLEVVKVADLPTRRDSLWPERRAALWSRISFAGQEVNVVTSHLGLSARERLAQVQALLGEEWVGPFLKDQPLLICGDLNCTPGSAVYRALSRQLTDTAAALGGATFSSIKPLLRLDYVFSSPHFHTKQVRVIRNQLTRLGSDHLPLVVDLALQQGGNASAADRGRDTLS